MKRARPDFAGFHQNVLMDEMMQVVGVDLLDVVDVDGGQSYLRARSNCHACTCKADCKDWSAQAKAEPVPSEPQAFCPNEGLFRVVKRRDR